MVLASPGLLLTPPPSSSPPKTPFRSYSAKTPPRYGNPTPPSPGARGSCRRGRGMGGQNGPQADTDVQCTPATARLRRGRPMTTLQPTKRQPATVGAVERGGRVTTARQTTTRSLYFAKFLQEQIKEIITIACSSHMLQFRTQLSRPFFNGAWEPPSRPSMPMTFKLAWCRVIVELSPHHKGGLSITPLPAGKSGMAAFYSATAQMVSWMGPLFAPSRLQMGC